MISPGKKLSYTQCTYVLLMYIIPLPHFCNSFFESCLFSGKIKIKIKKQKMFTLLLFYFLEILFTSLDCSFYIEREYKMYGVKGSGS